MAAAGDGRGCCAGGSANELDTESRIVSGGTVMVSNGLAGTRIPIASRIIGLADSFSSMTAPQPHGRGLDPVAALRDLDALAGTAFDPELTARLAGGVRGTTVRLA